jgi:hypothetical protein
VNGESRREKSLDRQLRAFQWIRDLAVLPDRRAGGSGEREAARRMAGWLGELGFEEVAEVPLPARPRAAWVLVLHLGLAALGVAVGGGLGVLLAGLVTLSFLRETRQRERWLSRLLPARASREVVARAGARRPAQRVVLFARLDTADAGSRAWERFARDWAKRGRGALPAPDALVGGLLGAAALLAVVVWLGAGGVLVGLARLALGIALVAGAALLLTAARAVPAVEEVCALAALLTCAEQLLAQLPEDAELEVVAAGAQEAGGCGMQVFCDARAGWPTHASYFVNFESSGGGALHWLRSESGHGSAPHPPLLIELARRVAASGVFGEVAAADLACPTGGRVPAARGFATLSLIALDADGLPHRVRRPDDPLQGVDPAGVIRAADFGAAVARAALRGEAGPLAVV